MFRKIFICIIGILVVFNCLALSLIVFDERIYDFMPNTPDTIKIPLQIGFVINNILEGIALFLLGLNYPTNKKE